MDQINTFSLYLLGKFLQTTVLSLDRPIRTYAYELGLAKAALDFFGLGLGRFKIAASAGIAEVLRKQLVEAVDLNEQDGEAVLPPDKAQALRITFERFEAIFGAEVSRAPIFYVSPKSIYSTEALVGRASAVYDGYREGTIPEEAVSDTDQAGRCLAFALPTAAGFHIARATEAVMKRQLEVFQKKVKGRDWGKYIDGLAASGANPKLVAALTQVRTLHRNPLIHPEETLTMPEANALWAICLSCIDSMVAHMVKKLPPISIQALDTPH